MPHLQIEIHVLHPSPSAESKAKGYLLPDFYSGATGLPGRFSEGLLLRRLDPRDLLSTAETLAGLAANAACEKFRWKFFFGPMSLMGTPYSAAATRRVADVGKSSRKRGL
jgi:hypothetical protein